MECEDVSTLASIDNAVLNHLLDFTDNELECTRPYLSKRVQHCIQNTKIKEALAKNLNNMKWIKKRDEEIKRKYQEGNGLSVQEQYDWEEGTFYRAARSGNVEIMVWLKEMGCPFDHNTFEGAALTDEKKRMPLE